MIYRADADQHADAADVVERAASLRLPGGGRQSRRCRQSRRRLHGAEASSPPKTPSSGRTARR